LSPKIILFFGGVYTVKLNSNIKAKFTGILAYAKIFWERVKRL